MAVPDRAADESRIATEFKVMRIVNRAIVGFHGQE